RNASPARTVQMARRSAPTHPLHSELLIEIAIIYFAAPTDADRVAAHETVERRPIKRANEKFHVFIKLAAMPQVTRKPAYWEIRESVQLIKHDSEMLFEFALVIGF